MTSKQFTVSMPESCSINDHKDVTHIPIRGISYCFMCHWVVKTAQPLRKGVNLLWENSKFSSYDMFTIWTKWDQNLKKATLYNDILQEEIVWYCKWWISSLLSQCQGLLGTTVLWVILWISHVFLYGEKASLSNYKYSFQWKYQS